MLRRALICFALLVPAFSGRGVPEIPPAAAPDPGHNFSLDKPVIAMIWVRPGTFLMSGTLSRGDDTVVTLTQGYWLGRTEVTQGQWQTIMDYYPIPSRFKGSNRPVETVSWDVIKIFVERLNQREGVSGRLPKGYAYALPTEAQWEYACRAGTTGNYAGNLDTLAWYDANSGGETHPVAQKQPNAWGFYDMHGNVMEWCADWFGGYPGGQVNDPTGVPTGQFRVLRGGGWGWPAGPCRSAFRHFYKPAQESSGLGFRLALAPRRRPREMGPAPGQ